MTMIMPFKKRKALLFSLLCLIVIVTFAVLILCKTSNDSDMKEARRILPGYSIVFEGHTNVIQRCGSLRAFSKQHEMMDFLQIFAQEMEYYNHPTNHPILIHETDERVIIQLPSRALFEPYNWTIYWGSYYKFKMEIDKKTKKIISALRG